MGVTGLFGWVVVCFDWVGWSLATSWGGGCGLWDCMMTQGRLGGCIVIGGGLGVQRICIGESDRGNGGGLIGQQVVVMEKI